MLLELNVLVLSALRTVNKVCSFAERLKDESLFDIEEPLLSSSPARCASERDSRLSP